jgi:hypothetical protein
MRRVRRIAWYVGSAAVIAATWIGVDLAASGDCLRPRADEIRGLLNSQLHVGDHADQVDKVLNGAKIAHDYDRFQNRYQGTVTDPRCGPYAAISIYVTFDHSEKLSKVDVFESYTAP